MDIPATNYTMLFEALAQWPMAALTLIIAILAGRWFKETVNSINTAHATQVDALLLSQRETIDRLVNTFNMDRTDMKMGFVKVENAILQQVETNQQLIKETATLVAIHRQGAL